MQEDFQKRKKANPPFSFQLAAWLLIVVGLTGLMEMLVANSFGSRFTLRLEIVSLPAGVGFLLRYQSMRRLCSAIYFFFAACAIISIALAISSPLWSNSNIHPVAGFFVGVLFAVFAGYFATQLNSDLAIQWCKELDGTSIRQRTGQFGLTTLIWATAAIALAVSPLKLEELRYKPIEIGGFSRTTEKGICVVQYGIVRDRFSPTGDKLVFVAMQSNSGLKRTITIESKSRTEITLTYENGQKIHFPNSFQLCEIHDGIVRQLRADVSVAEFMSYIEGQNPPFDIQSLLDHVSKLRSQGGIKD